MPAMTGAVNGATYDNNNQPNDLQPIRVLTGGAATGTQVMMIVDSTGAEVPLASLLASAWTFVFIQPNDAITFARPPPGGLWCTAAATLVVTSNNLDITISVPANTRIPILVSAVKANGTNLNGGSLYGLA
jgi:hypothetical protein